MAQEHTIAKTFEGRPVRCILLRVLASAGQVFQTGESIKDQVAKHTNAAPFDAIHVLMQHSPALVEREIDAQGRLMDRFAPTAMGVRVGLVLQKLHDEGVKIATSSRQGAAKAPAKKAPAKKKIQKRPAAPVRGKNSPRSKAPAAHVQDPEDVD